MRARGGRLVLVAALLVAGCGDGGGDDPKPVTFGRVELPAPPVALATSGDGLLVGVRRAGQPVVPGLLRRAADGSLTEIPVHPGTPYGQLARWYSISTDGDRIVALGGERGGAHGNVRWSAWTGTAAGITEYQQAFSMFGGYGAGELVDAVQTPGAAALVGSWESKRAGLDVTVWTADGSLWTRHASAGTALESGPEALGFPVAATGFGPGILVAGWQLTTASGGNPAAVVWRSASGNTGWTATTLPESGRDGGALAVRCQATTCDVAGKVDGKLALWRLADGAWTRVAGVPSIAVGERDRLVAPVRVGGRTALVVADGGRVKVVWSDGGEWSVRDVAGPVGPVTGATVVGATVFVLSGADENDQALWQVDAGALH